VFCNGFILGIAVFICSAGVFWFGMCDVLQISRGDSASAASTLDYVHNIWLYTTDSQYRSESNIIGKENVKNIYLGIKESIKCRW
jgi:hypothetical protein